MTPIEAVACAIAQELDGSPWRWEVYLAAARTAIQAMREPTEAIVKAGWDWDRDEDGITGLWRDMIDAAIAEGPED